MGKKRYTIRIYKRHDPELVSLTCMYDFSLTKAIYCALKAYAKGDAFCFTPPKRREHAAMPARGSIQKELALNEEKDRDVIRLVENVVKGNRNAFMKNVLRMYLRCPVTEECLIEKGAPTFMEPSLKKAECPGCLKKKGGTKKRLESPVENPEKIPQDNSHTMPDLPDGDSGVQDGFDPTDLFSEIIGSL